MVNHSLFHHRFQFPKGAIAALAGAALSVACSNPTTNSIGPSTLDGSPVQPLPAGASPGVSPSPALANEFTFPKASCGDVATTPTENWYVVYVDGATVEDIRTKYCGDAVSTVRPTTGAETVQVASFTDFNKATRFAAAVGGTVEQLTQAPSSSTTASPPSVTQPGLSQPRLATPNGQSPSSLSPSPGATTGLGTLKAQEADFPINVRASASTDAEINSVGYSGDRVRILSSNQGSDGFTWYNVQLDSGESGWVRGDLLTVGSGTSPSPSTGSSNLPSSTFPPSSPSASPGATLGKSGTITAADPESPINVRSRASISSDIQDAAYPGDTVRIVGEARGDDGATWYNVQFESGSRGWVRSDFIDLQ